MSSTGSTVLKQFTDASTAKIEDFLERYVAGPRPRRNQDALPADDDAAAEDTSEDEDDLAEGMDGLNVQGARRTKFKYLRMLREVANRRREDIVIDLKDLKRVG